MSSPVAVVGLVFDGHDLQRPDLDVFFEITEGLDDLPEVRGDDQLIPFRSGRLPGLRIPHRRPVVATGHVMGPADATARPAFRAYLDEIKGWMDPTAGEKVLVATLTDGSTRWITAAARNVIGGEGFLGEYRAFSLEWEAVSDPMWHSSWGTLALDGTWNFDGMFTLPSSAPLVIAGSAVIDTLGNAAVERVWVRFVGPSVGPVGLVTSGAAPIGFAVARTLGAGEVLDVDNYGRTVTLGGVSLRNLMTLRAANQHGEYLRLPPGLVTLWASGGAAETRILFDPAWQ